MLKIPNAVTMLCRKASMLKCNNARMQPSNKLNLGHYALESIFKRIPEYAWIMPGCSWNDGTRKWSLKNTGKIITGIAKLPKMGNACQCKLAKMPLCNTVMWQSKMPLCNTVMWQYNKAMQMWHLSQYNNANVTSATIQQCKSDIVTM